MKRRYGFNLIEIMVAIAISASILLAMTNSFSSLYGGFLFNNNKIELQRSLRYSIVTIERDLQNAGIFGPFSFHNQFGGATSYEAVNVFSTCGSGDWCTFQSMGVGVKSYSSGTTISGSGISATSDILRIQYGGNKAAYFNSVSYNAGSQISTIDFYVPSGNSSSLKTYMLSAANHSYLVNLAGNTANDQLTNLNINVKASVGTFMSDPDQASMMLVPFITKYYFVNANGLQVVSYDGSSLSSPTLISSRINQMNISYKLDNIPATNFNHYGSSNSYVWCSTFSMNDISNSFCYNKWSQITAVNIVLSGGSNQNVGTNFTQLTQLESDTVGWLW